MFNLPLNAGVPGFRVGLPDDENGSVRRALPATLSAPPFGYDPFGNALQTTAPTAFGSTGLFYNADSGLYPTTYRAYDPVAGHTPSPDAVRGTPDRAANLYADVAGTPPSFANPPRLSTNQTALFGTGLLSPQAASPAPPRSPPWQRPSI